MSRPSRLASPAASCATVTGWLLDLYADPQGELALWLLEEEEDCCSRGGSGRKHGGANRSMQIRPCLRRRLRLRQPFPIAFYAAGPNPRLRLLWQYLARANYQLIADGLLTLSRQERRDLFQPEPVTVLAAEVQKPGLLPELFHRAAAAFPDLTYYDADLPLAARHAAIYGTFPLAKLRVSLTAADGEPATVQELQALDSPWDLDAPPAPLRVMHLSPDCDPRRGAPAWLEVQVSGADLSHDEGEIPTARPRPYTCRLSLQPERALLIGLRALLCSYDPDLLLTGWGDTWLLPHLLSLSEKLGLPLPLNRGAGDDHAGAVGTGLDTGYWGGLASADPPLQHPPLPCDARQPILRRPERSYQAYGQVIYRGQQVLLSGRWHIDKFNAMMYHDYALDGILESARVSALPVQQAARLSPGTGISTMQIITALRQGVMTPWRKQQAEMPKSALDLLHADQGGLVYQPIIGLHRGVAEIDFISMYPSIMARFNVSPETTSLPQVGEPVGGCLRDVMVAPVEATGETTDVVTTSPGERPVVATSVAAGRQVEWVPEINLWVDQSAPGLVPQTLGPLLEKRVALKQRIAALPRWDPRKKLYQARAAAHKWLLVTCFGYLGYKNARFGRIEAHQAVTAYSRECLLRAKEAAEDLGYTVLHMYVDGLWVQRQETTVQSIQPLLDEIARRTGLPIALEGIYRWVAFLPSRASARLPVANRYFGVFQDGSLKVRGLEARRGDTPAFIAAVQMGLLERLASLDSPLHQARPEILAFLRRELRRLRRRRVPLEQLLVAQKLSRPLEQYRSPSPAARAAAQLAAMGKSTRPGQTVRFLYLRGEHSKGEDIHAWDCPPTPPAERLDIERYTTLFIRACAAVLQPFGLDEEELRVQLMR